MIGSILSGAADLQNSFFNIASGIVQMINNERAYKEDVRRYEQQQENYQNEFEWNKNTWQQQFDYQDYVNRTLWDREDNAIQRRAKDLATAGINPIMAGLDGAQATAGGVISPMFMSGGGNVGSGALTTPQVDFGTNANNLGKAIQNFKELQEEKRHNKELENQAETNANNTLNMFNDEIKSRNMNAEEERKAQKAINLLHDITNYVTAERHNKSQEEIAKQERDLKWKIEKHEAIKELIGATGIPSLDAILKDFVDAFTDKETFDLLKNNNFLGSLKAWWGDLFTKNTQILNENEINKADKTPTKWRKDENGREYIIKGGAKVYKKND